MKSDDFYLAFENKFRGSNELILSRLQFYSCFIQPLIKYYIKGSALDLGVGRGEWLQILRINGFDAMGIDLNQCMVNECLQAGFNVKQIDAQSFLQTVPQDSQLVISAFHLLEHLDFADVMEIFQQAFRCLKPGGILIAETPNPDNIAVGCSRFYIDPTHQRPIPSQLLEFAAQYTGYSKTKIVNLQEPPWVSKLSTKIGLQDVLGNVSPDYGLIAVKDGPEFILNEFDNLFSSSYGVSLDDLAQSYENRILKIERNIDFILDAMNRQNPFKRFIKTMVNKLHYIKRILRVR